jgi:hypothetical protein
MGSSELEFEIVEDTSPTSATIVKHDLPTKDVSFLRGIVDMGRYVTRSIKPYPFNVISYLPVKGEARLTERDIVVPRLTALLVMEFGFQSQI